MIFKHEKYIFTNFWYIIKLFSSGGGIPMSIYTMNAVCPFIKKSPKELENPHRQPNGMEKYYKWEKALHEWLMKNRDSVKFNNDVNVGWFWSD